MTAGVKLVDQKINMNISLGMPRLGLNPATGYGYAAQHIVNSLQLLGHAVNWSDPKADVQLNFTQPSNYKLHRGQYQIAYTPWESTVIPERWREKLNLCDEIWATSDWCANVFTDNGYKNVKVYSHGIEDIWTPKKRLESETIKFLHVGEPAPRKAGQMVVDAFVELYGNNPKYSLTIKAHKSNTTRIYDNRLDKNIIGVPGDLYSNIKLITDELDDKSLVKLYHDHDILVYPSYGEGFGFIPLQGLASGMPTISTYDWAQYKDYIGPLKLKSNLIDSPWEYAHEGQVYEPEYQHLVKVMADAANNFKVYSGYYFAQSTKIHKEYDWVELTKNAFSHLTEKF